MSKKRNSKSHKIKQDSTYPNNCDATNSSLSNKLFESKQLNMSKDEASDGKLVPKPPEFLENLLWLILHGKKYWWLLLLAALIIGITSIIVLPQINLKNKAPQETHVNISDEDSKEPQVDATVVKQKPTMPPPDNHTETNEPINLGIQSEVTVYRWPSDDSSSIVSGSSSGSINFDDDWLINAHPTQTMTIPTSGMSAAQGTISLWIEPKNVSNMKFIFNHILNNANRLSLYSVGGKLAAGLGSNATIETNITNLLVGQPMHLALTWNKTNYAIYVDGQIKREGVFSGLTGLNSKIGIGNFGPHSYDSLNFSGKINDIRIYNRSLKANEIETLYLTHDAEEDFWDSGF